MNGLSDLRKKGHLLSRNNFNNKGQLFSSDITIASVIFLVAIATAFFLWNSTTETINNAENLRNLEKRGSETIEQLIRTPGVPDDWNVFTVQVPGLATEDRIINETKALAFINLLATNSTDYDQNKYILGLGNYDFFLNATYLDNSQVVIDGLPFAVGKKPTITKNSISLFRTTIFNDTIVRLNFIIWE